MTTTTKLLNSYSNLNPAGQDFLTAIAEAVAFGYKTGQNSTHTQTNTTRAEERKKEKNTK